MKSKNENCHNLANILQIWMIPHIHTLFEFISIPYENQHQTLNIKKIDRGQIRFREYSITLPQPSKRCSFDPENFCGQYNVCSACNERLIQSHALFGPLIYMWRQNSSKYLTRFSIERNILKCNILLYYNICLCTTFLWPLCFGWLLVLSRHQEDYLQIFKCMSFR